MHYIYVITNKLNNKIYVGQTNNLTGRWKTHCNNKRNNLHIDSSIRKHGKENYTYEEIDKFDSLTDANEAEEFYIQYLTSLYPNGYNHSKGGNNYKKTQETIAKTSESLKKWAQTENGKIQLEKLQEIGKKRSKEEWLEMSKKSQITKSNWSPEKKKLVLLNQSIGHLGKLTGLRCLTELQVKEMVCMNDKNIRIEEISKKYNLDKVRASKFIEGYKNGTLVFNTSETVYKKQNGNKSNYGKSQFTKKQVETLLEMKQNKKTNVEISKILNISTDRVKNTIYHFNNGTIKYSEKETVATTDVVKHATKFSEELIIKCMNLKEIGFSARKISKEIEYKIGSSAILILIKKYKNNEIKKFGEIK